MMRSFLVFTLLGVFLVLKNADAKKCLPLPASFMKNMQHCFATLDKEDQQLYLRQEEPEKRELKCFRLCLLEKIGYFKDGEFQVEEMKVIARKYMPTKELAEALITRNEDSMLKAMEEGVDECDIAYQYFKIKEEKEKEEPLLTKIFCSGKEEDEEKKDGGERDE